MSSKGEGAPLRFGLRIGLADTNRTPICGPKRGRSRRRAQATVSVAEFALANETFGARPHPFSPPQCDSRLSSRPRSRGALSGYPSPPAAASATGRAAHAPFPKGVGSASGTCLDGSVLWIVVEFCDGRPRGLGKVPWPTAGRRNSPLNPLPPPFCGVERGLRNTLVDGWSSCCRMTNEEPKESHLTIVPLPVLRRDRGTCPRA